MSTTVQSNGEPGAELVEEGSFDYAEQAARSLGAIESEVKRQGRETRRIYTAFAFFAVLALVIALVNLVVVGFKLGTKDIRVVNATTAAVPAGAAAAKPATPVAPPHRVAVSLKEFKVLPTSAQAASGKVTFNVHNSGAATHEFVVVRTDKPAGGLPLKSGRADETGNVGETGDLAPGASKSVTLNLKPGHYALICNLPGHYVAGQHADFTVK
jgi:uncharacterized cupredoxin-like copper-binding protein